MLLWLLTFQRMVIATRRFSMEKQRRGGDDLKRLSLFEKIKKKDGHKKQQR